MGKAENIKRAKRLKEAKRKKEKEAMLMSGITSVSKILKKRFEKKGFLVEYNTREIKYSELLKEFVDPIISEDDDLSIIQMKYTFGAQAWNSAILKEKSEERYQLAKKEFLDLTSDTEEFQYLFDQMVIRKQEEYSEYKKIFVDCNVVEMRDLDYRISVVTTFM